MSRVAGLVGASLAQTRSRLTAELLCVVFAGCVTSERQRDPTPRPASFDISPVPASPVRATVSFAADFTDPRRRHVQGSVLVESDAPTGVLITVLKDPTAMEHHGRSVELNPGYDQLKIRCAALAGADALDIGEVRIYRLPAHATRTLKFDLNVPANSIAICAATSAQLFAGTGVARPDDYLATNWCETKEGQVKGSKVVRHVSLDDRGHPRLVLNDQTCVEVPVPEIVRVQR